MSDKACAKHFTVQLCTTKLAQSTSQYYFVLQDLHKILSSSTVSDKACAKHFTVQLCTTKLAQSTSQYNFVLQRYKVLPSTTFYCKAYTKYFPVLCTAKLAQHVSQDYFELQSLDKVVPYYFVLQSSPVLHCTTKLAPSTFQHNFILKVQRSTFQYYLLLQSLHKVLPSTMDCKAMQSLHNIFSSTTLYYKVWTK